jgi:gamma-glutamyltranspeptidase/glutathione hydrolase
MLNSVWATRGMVVAPHALAAQSGLAVLRDGGNAIEAMVAAAASIAMVYPHMNSIGGDAFWLVLPPAGAPFAIEACGPAAQAASIDWYRARGQDAIPSRGAAAANTMAGTIGGWAAALQQSAGRFAGRLPLSRLLADAIAYGRDGFAVTPSQAAITAAKLPELQHQPGFDQAFLTEGAAPAAGSLMRRERLAVSLEQLARHGLDDFYRGDLRRPISPPIAPALSSRRRWRMGMASCST